MTRINASQHLGHYQNFDKFCVPTKREKTFGGISSTIQTYGAKSVQNYKTKNYPESLGNLKSYPDSHSQRYCRQYQGKDKTKQAAGTSQYFWSDKKYDYSSASQKNTGQFLSNPCICCCHLNKNLLPVKGGIIYLRLWRGSLVTVHIEQPPMTNQAAISNHATTLDVI